MQLNQDIVIELKGATYLRVSLVKRRSCAKRKAVPELIASFSSLTRQGVVR
jgi:hypothetical protein